MSASYNIPPQNKKDQVRLEIGDTDTDNNFLEDEEIEFFLEKENDNVLKAAIRSCQAIVSQLSREVNYQASMLRQDAAQAYEHYRQRIKDLRQRLGVENLGDPVFVQSGDDARAPSFYVGMHDSRDQTKDADDFEPPRDDND